MIKRPLLIGLMISCFTISAHCQNESVENVNSIDYSSITTLDAQLELIGQKELQIKQAAQNSRSVNEQLQKELHQLFQVYRDLLNKELLVSRNDELSIHLKDELKKVEDILSLNSNKH